MNFFLSSGFGRRLGDEQHIFPQMILSTMIGTLSNEVTARRLIPVLCGEVFTS